METPKKDNRFATKRDLFLAIGFIVVLVAVDLSPLGGNIRFYTKWIECGQRPVATDTSIHVDASQPHYYRRANAFPEFRGVSQFFCTPLEAEQAGYSASSTEYSFPHLEKQN